MMKQWLAPELKGHVLEYAAPQERACAFTVEIEKHRYQQCFSAAWGDIS